LNKVKAFYQNYGEKNIPTHIWIDNFCINQANKEEKGSEVKRQKQYYSQATATLVAIDAEIGNDFALNNAEIYNDVDKSDEVVLVGHLLVLITKSP